MTTAKYFRATGQLWNINKLRKELEAALGQAVTCAVAADGQTLEIQYTVPGAENIVNQVVGAHIAQSGYTIQADNTGSLFTNYGEFFYGTGAIEDGNATGLWGGFPAREYPAASGSFWTLMQLNAGTLTWASNYLTGKQTSGAGAVTQGTDGISILSVLSPTSINQIKFVTSDGYETGYYESYPSGATPNRSGIIEIASERESGAAGTGISKIILVARDGGSTPTRFIISDDDTDKYFAYVDHWGDF